MASTTPNIGLTLPTGTEKVSRQLINTNNTKIDTAIGTLNSKITNIEYGEILSGDIKYAKLGKIGMVKIANGTYSGTVLGTLPTSMRPFSSQYTPDFVDSYSKKRIQINNSCQVISADTLNNDIIRGTIVYLIE